MSEVIGVRAADLDLNRPAHVRLLGKGNKERLTPLWPETARTLRGFLDETRRGHAVDDPIFHNAWGRPITRFGVDHIIKKYTRTAAGSLPSLRKKRVSPHIVRHTAAVHMLNSGVDVNVVRAWLGHVDLRTTNIYAEINMATKRKALEACAPPDKAPRSPHWKRDPDLLSWLEGL